MAEGLEVVYVLSMGEAHEGGSVLSVHKTFLGAQAKMIESIRAHGGTPIIAAVSEFAKQTGIYQSHGYHFWSVERVSVEE